MYSPPPADDSRLAALAVVLDKLRADSPLEALVQVATDYLRAELLNPGVITGVGLPDPEMDTFIWLGLYDPDRHTLTGIGGYLPEKTDLPLLRQRLTITPGDIWEQSVIQKVALDIPDLRDEPQTGEWQTKMRRLSISGATLMPIRHQDRIMGVALLGTSRWGMVLRNEGRLRCGIVLSELSAGLERLEASHQQEQVKRPGEPLVQVLGRCRAAKDFESRLKLLIDQAYQFISPDRAILYWYEPAAGCFWPRLSAPRGRRVEDKLPQEAVQNLVQALLTEDVVSIADASSNVKLSLSAVFLQQTQAQAILAAPILSAEGKDLLGFFCLADRQPRMWQAPEKNHLLGLAQTAALLSPLDSLESTIERVESDHRLLVGIGQAVYTSQDWQAALKAAAQQLEKHLKVDRWLLLLQNPDTHHYEITYQSHRKRPLAGPLSALHPLDQELLEQNTGAIGIANWGSDLKFMTWRHTLLNQGVKSLVVANSAPGQSPSGLLVIAQGEPRHWSPEECQLVQAIAQQLGVVARQWQLEQQNQQQQDMYRAVCQGLELLPDLELGEASQLPLLKHMAQLLQVPQVVLVTWTASDQVGKILASDPTQERFSVATDQTVDAEQDPLIQAALATSGPWLQNAVELEPGTRQWLTGMGIGQVLALALRPQVGQPPTGVLLALDGPHQVWPDRLLQFIQLLGQQLSRIHRTHNLLQTFRNRAQEMGCRLWLWQWRWQDLHRELERLAQKDPNDPEVGHRLTNLLKAVSLWPDQDAKPLLGDALQAIALPGLLRRAVDRVGDMISKRQLWLKIHQTATGHTLGHPLHLELVLGQLLQFACSRSPVGGRVDVWCQPVDEQWLEIVITDYGAVLSTLLEALQAAGRPEPLVASPLDQSPGRELSLCRFLMAESGAELTFERLPDGRFSSRLYLPAGRT